VVFCVFGEERACALKEQKPNKIEGKKGKSFVNSPDDQQDDNDGLNDCEDKLEIGVQGHVAAISITGSTEIPIRLAVPGTFNA
jgi:hypothetical protein